MNFQQSLLHLHAKFCPRNSNEILKVEFFMFGTPLYIHSMFIIVILIQIVEYLSIIDSKIFVHYDSGRPGERTSAQRYSGKPSSSF